MYHEIIWQFENKSQLRAGDPKWAIVSKRGEKSKIISKNKINGKLKVWPQFIKYFYPFKQSNTQSN